MRVWSLPWAFCHLSAELRLEKPEHQCAPPVCAEEQYRARFLIRLTAIAGDLVSPYCARTSSLPLAFLPDAEHGGYTSHKVHL